MKHLCFAVAVFVLCEIALSERAVAAEAGQTQTPSPVPFEPQEYSPPLGGDSCSTPTPIS
ncbi:hypothetical protein L2D14_18170 [Thalassospiraceae bacterium LMO-JJ14]|nr:hypothetical protein L2D14_18170 [Thalassospiraceae bacterium LMO-JJ14]